MSEHLTCDVLVVGMGPGGSTAARFAAMNGAKVIGIDKRAEIGTPVQCAEAVSEGILKHIGLEAPKPRWITWKVAYVKLVSPSGRAVDLNDERVAKMKYGYVLDRKVFDKDLANMAASEGVDVMLKTRFVSGERIEGGIVRAYARHFGQDVIIDAKVTIAADGVASRVGPYFGVKTVVPLKHMESCVQYEMTNVDLDGSIEFYFGKDVAPGGYVWVFPKGERTANVGIGIIPSMTDKNAKYFLDKFIASPRMEGARVVEINAGGVPVCRPLKETYADNMLLVGDAARVVNPLTGGGIATAIESGRYAGITAAQAIAEGRTDKDALSKYQDMWKDSFGKRLEMFYKAQQVLTSMSDSELDDSARALEKCDFESINEMEILKAVAKTNMKLLLKFKTFLT